MFGKIKTWKIYILGMFQNGIALRKVDGGFEEDGEDETSEGAGGVEKRHGAAEVPLQSGHSDCISSRGPRG